MMFDAAVHKPALNDVVADADGLAVVFGDHRARISALFRTGTATPGVRAWQAAVAPYGSPPLFAAGPLAANASARYMIRREESGTLTLRFSMRTCAMPNARERIEKVISENPVVLFMKGTPEFPQCGFSGQVIQILDYLGAPVHGVNVLEDADIRQGIKEYANWPTIPQLYIKGEFVGGCDITREMFQSGELAAMLSDAGVPVKTQAGA
jgi:monothiol glutaredoxin